MNDNRNDKSALGSGSDTLAPLARLFIIHDSEGKDQERPRVTIEREISTTEDGSVKYDWVVEESIDVIAAVREDAANIGHPAVVFALQRWEAVVQFYHHLKLRREDDLQYRRTLKFLKLVGEALLEGAKERALSKETALSWSIGNERENPHREVLDHVWELLGSEDIKRVRNVGSKFRKLVNILKENEDQYDPYDRGPEAVESVIEFLRKGGKRFLRSRGTRQGIETAYYSWRFSLAPQTVRKYRSMSDRDQEELAEVTWKRFAYAAVTAKYYDPEYHLYGLPGRVFKAQPSEALVNHLKRN